MLKTAIVCVVGIGVFLNGFVIQVLWGWFAVKFGLPGLSFGHAIGLSTLITSLCPVIPYSTKGSDEEIFGQAMGLFIVVPILNLILGFAAKTMM